MPVSRHLYEVKTRFRALWDSSAWQAALEKMAQQINISCLSHYGIFFNRGETQQKGRADQLSLTASNGMV